uniref:E3 ubiquitin-protein transferase RMND5A isoform X2 n=1 Tax=Myxine glutinosa TaxID=7769 RepID=UPI00358F9131
MEQCMNVEREVDKVLQKFGLYAVHCERTLENLIQYVTGIRQELAGLGEDAELSPTHALVLSHCCKKIRDTVQKLASDHKDIHGSVSKVGKAIDRNYETDVSSVAMEGVFNSSERQQLLNRVLVEHLLRQGMLDVAETLSQEAGLPIDAKQKEPFVELNRILEALRQHDLRPALEWAVINRERLLTQNSSLEFKLHRLFFIQLLAGGSMRQQEALEYARNFQPFASQHQQDIQVLMGSLMYLRQGIQASPYVHLLDSNQWAEICDLFTRDACSLLGLSVESPLSVTFSAGCIALPSLINIKAVIEQRQCTGVWNQKDELPIEVDLGRGCWYHSVFACPILRQQTTDSNPPMRLVCGHIISRDALNKLVNGNKLKCPYCPVEHPPSEAKQVYF